MEVIRDTGQYLDVNVASSYFYPQNTHYNGVEITQNFIFMKGELVMKFNAKIVGTVIAALGAVVAGGVFSKSKKDEENTTNETATTEATTTTETTAETETETPEDNSAE